jgi:hypothetical protein
MASPSVVYVVIPAPTKTNITPTLGFVSQAQCEQFQMRAFGITCATCDRTDRDCPMASGTSRLRSGGGSCLA